jgi:hypothetical protein
MLIRRHTRGVGALASCAGLACAAAGVFAQPVDSFWLEADDGVWSDSENWTNGVPNNGPDGEFNAVIDAQGDPYVVTLDIDAILAGLTIGWSSADLDLTVRTMDTRSFSISAGRVSSRSVGSGVLRVRDSASMTGGTLENFGELNVEGTASVTNTVIRNIGRIVLGAGSSTTIGSGTTFENTEVESLGQMTISSDDDTDICNTNVGSLSGGLAWSGPGNISLEGDSSITIGTDSTMTIEASVGDRAIVGDTKAGVSVTNNGTVRVGGAVPAPGRGRVDRISVLGTEFTNNGVVEVAQGELAFDQFSQLVDPDFQFVGGAWVVRNGAGLDLIDQFVLTLAADVTLDGAASRFGALNTLRTVEDDGRLRIENGRDFSAQEDFWNFGEVSIGAGSDLNVAFGLNNIDDGRLVDGTYDIAGRLITSLDQGGVESLEGGADVTLRGEGSRFAAVNGLERVGADSRFAVLEGRQFTTRGNFFVAAGGELEVGLGSVLDVTGQLENFTGDGDLIGGKLIIAGVLRGQTQGIRQIANDTTLDGLASIIVNGQGVDVFSSLERITETGRLALLNGRTLDVLDDLIVDGELFIDPGTTDTGPGGPPDRDFSGQLSSNASIFFAQTAEVSIVLRGDGQITAIAADGGIFFDSSSAGQLNLVLGDGYAPTFGDTFVLLEADAIDGFFKSVTGLDLGGGLTLELVFEAQRVSATVVPVPGAAGAVLLGGLIASRRRRA